MGKPAKRPAVPEKTPPAVGNDQVDGGSGTRPVRRPTNLTLEVDAVVRAERFARRQGTSLSQLVSDLLRALPDADDEARTTELSPAVERLYGVAAGGTSDRETYRDHLATKYGSRE